MRLLVSAFVLGAMAMAHAAPQVRVVGSGSGPLYDVNAATNLEVSLWSTGFATDSLAMDGAGNLYSAQANGVLFNVTSPFAFPVGPTGYTQIGDLDYAPGGLWGFSNANQTLFFFDFGSLSVTYSVALTSFATETVTGVAYKPANGSVFLSAYAALNADKLYEVPSNANSATLIGSMTHGDAFSYISDIDFDSGGSLYAMTWYHRDYYVVNTSNAATSLVSNGPHRDVTGMAIEAVPEPGTLSLLAGVALAFWGRRRKQPADDCRYRCGHGV